MQIESSKFTSILAQLPGDERTEFFLWGDTPLGVFQEPTSLNQLISETSEEQQPSLDVVAVKNGPFFSVFVEKQTGFTFQLGAENLGEVTEDNVVALTELKDAVFSSQGTFACGYGFVIGSSKPIDQLSPEKRSTTPLRTILSAAKSCLSEIKSQGLQEEGSSPIASSKCSVDEVIT